MSDDPALQPASEGDAVRRDSRARPATDPRMRVGGLLPGIVHELKHPLAVVDGYAQLLHERLAADDELREDVDVLLREARRMQVQLDALLAWVCVDDRLAEPLDARDLLDAAFSVCAFECRRRGVRTGYALDASAPAVLGRRSACVHVFATLALHVGDVGGRHLHVTVPGADAQSAAGARFVCDLDVPGDASPAGVRFEPGLLREVVAGADGVLETEPGGRRVGIVLPRVP